MDEGAEAGVDDGLGGGGLRFEVGVVKGGEWKSLLLGEYDKLGEDDLLNNLELSSDDLETGVEVNGTAGGRGCWDGVVLVACKAEARGLAMLVDK